MLPYFEICQGKCTHLELLPVELGMDRGNAEKNIPYVADEKTAEKIAEYLTRVSKRCRTDFADIQNKKECGGNRQWQNHYLRNWAANTKGKGII